MEWKLYGGQICEHPVTPDELDITCRRIVISVIVISIVDDATGSATLYNSNTGGSLGHLA